MRRGCHLVELDAADLDATDLEAIEPDTPTLITVDDAEGLGAALHQLGRRHAQLPAQTRLLVATRRTALDWVPATVLPLTAHLRMAGLRPAEADALLKEYAVLDPAAREEIVAWARGLPLALVLAASSWHGRDSGASASGFTVPLETEDDLVGRLAGDALTDLDPDVVAAVVLASVADAELVADVVRLNKGESATTFAALGRLPFVDLANGRLSLHPRLTQILADRLRADDPHHCAALTLRIAEVLRRRAIDGDPRALPHLAGLVQNQFLRDGLAHTATAQLYADRFRPPDTETLRAAIERHWPAGWALVAPWLTSGHLHVVRSGDATPRACVAALPLATAGDLQPDLHPLVTPALSVAEQLGLSDHSVLTPLQVLLDDDPEGSVMQFRNAVALRRCGVVNPRADVVVEITGARAEQQVLTAYGYREEQPHRSGPSGAPGVWAIELGPEGIAGLLFSAVVDEQGGIARTADEDGSVILAALRDYHDDAALAQLAIAPTGLSPARAAELVRTWVRDSLVQRLRDEPVLLDLVRRRYLEPGATHTSVMRDVFASRSTYFRKLNQARGVLSGDGIPPP